jgi:signal transduction histidine kinase
MQSDLALNIPRDRPRFTIGSWAVLGVALLVLGLGVALFWLRVTTPSDGARMKIEEWPWHPEGFVIAPIDDQLGGLQQGDLVVAIDGRRLESWAQALFTAGAPRLHWRIGQTVVYTVLRSGRVVDVPVILRHFPIGALLAQLWSVPLVLLLFWLIAAFIFRQRPVDRAARALFLSVSSIGSLALWSMNPQISDLVGRNGFWLGKVIGLVAFTTLWIAGIRFWLGFPAPRAVLARHRWLSLLVYLPLLAPIAGAILWPSEGALDRAERIDKAMIALGFVSFISTAISAFTSYRATRDSARRQQIRVVARAALVCGGCIGVAGPLAIVVLGYPLLDRNLLTLFILPVPLAFGFAILRHHLFDIDIIVNRALVYGALTAIVVGVYVLAVGALSLLLEAQGNLLIALLATGLVAILFQPLRERLQRGVNRLMYGERDDPYQILSRLGQRLEATLVPDMVLPTIVETIKDALKLPYVAIALKQGDEMVLAAESGDKVTRWPGDKVTDTAPYASVTLSPPHLVSLSLAYQGETIGELRLAPRPGEDDFSAIDRRLFADLVRQAGIAVHAVRLHTQTLQLAADLQRSREQLVAAREEERRRIRRDLHDGLGPALAGFTLQIDAAREELVEDIAAADAMLVDLKADVQAAIADIRELVYGLRPPALDELGLVGALRAQVARYSGPALQILFKAPTDLPSLPAAVEVAAYRIILEALTNVVRHAEAHTCAIRLVLGEHLELEIRDDGRGLAEHHLSGVGLAAIHERAAELGGSCAIESRPGVGTCVRASLPVG